MKYQNVLSIVDRSIHISSQFREAADFVNTRLKDYGFDNATVHEYPADGKTMYGTQKARMAWDVDFAELWELSEQNGNWVKQRRLADWSALPLSLAQDSLSGDITAELIDIGAGTSERDYSEMNVKGKLVLTSSQPEAVQDIAVGKYGAAGIVSYAANQRSAWWKEDDRLIRWGHLDSFPKNETFGFMISLGEARRLQARLESGEKIRFHALVEARHHVGKYALVDALIKGEDKKLGDQEILFTCHLDHPRPGANDNASGCVSILEAARALRTLINSGALPAPKRTLRFIWPSEIEGSLVYLSARTDTGNIKANIHLDMVGGGPVTKSIFRVSGAPMSVPSFIADLGHEIGRFVNQQTLDYAAGKSVPYPLVSVEGGKEPLMALMEGISLGSDHQVFHEGSWRIPGIYLHDWPDRYIHTNFDTAANIDPTKLKRSAFIAAMTGWYLANMDETYLPELLGLLQTNSVARKADFMRMSAGESSEDAATIELVRQQLEVDKLKSIESFVALNGAEVENMTVLQQLATFPVHEKPAFEAKDETKVYERNEAIKGPMGAFGYGYLNDHLPEEKRSRLELVSFRSDWGHTGYEYAFEALNLVNGVRTVKDIRSWLTAELGPVPISIVDAYLEALESIDVIRVVD